MFFRKKYRGLLFVLRKEYQRCPSEKEVPKIFFRKGDFHDQSASKPTMPHRLPKIKPVPSVTARSSPITKSLTSHICGGLGGGTLPHQQNLSLADTSIHKQPNHPKKGYIQEPTACHTISFQRRKLLSVL